MQSSKVLAIAFDLAFPQHCQRLHSLNLGVQALGHTHTHQPPCPIFSLEILCACLSTPQLHASCPYQLLSILLQMGDICLALDSGVPGAVVWSLNALALITHQSDLLLVKHPGLLDSLLKVGSAGVSPALYSYRCISLHCTGSWPKRLRPRISRSASAGCHSDCMGQMGLHLFPH